MNRHPSQWIRSSSFSVVALATAFTLDRPSTSTLTRVDPPPATQRVLAHELASRQHPLRAADGTRVGTWVRTEDGVRVYPRGRSPVDAAGLQEWRASADGRTLVGCGDARGPEHPFELSFHVHRDGVRVAQLEESFSTESEFVIGEDGTLALVGHAAGERGRPFALVVEPDGSVRWRQALPRGAMARDPVLIGRELFVRMHGVRTEGEDGSIVRVDAAGAREAVSLPGALAFVGFPSTNRALVRTREELVCLDVPTARIAWRRSFARAAAGRHAWETCSSPTGPVFALVSTEPRRRGASEPTIELAVLDAADGADVTTLALLGGKRPSEVDVLGTEAGLRVDWIDGEEAFTWAR